MRKHDGYALLSFLCTRMNRRNFFWANLCILDNICPHSSNQQHGNWRIRKCMWKPGKLQGSKSAAVRHWKDQQHAVCIDNICGSNDSILTKRNSTGLFSWRVKTDSKKLFFKPWPWIWTDFRQLLCKSTLFSPRKICQKYKDTSLIKQTSWDYSCTSTIQHSQERRFTHSWFTQHRKAKKRAAMRLFPSQNQSSQTLLELENPKNQHVFFFFFLFLFFLSRHALITLFCSKATLMACTPKYASKIIDEAPYTTTNTTVTPNSMGADAMQPPDALCASQMMPKMTHARTRTLASTNSNRAVCESVLPRKKSAIPHETDKTAATTTKALRGVAQESYQPR